MALEVVGGQVRTLTACEMSIAVTVAVIGIAVAALASTTLAQGVAIYLGTIGIEVAVLWLCGAVKVPERTDLRMIMTDKHVWICCSRLPPPFLASDLVEAAISFHE